MARNPELDHEFRENKTEKQPGTAGFVYIDENHSRSVGSTFHPLESPQMASLSTMGTEKKQLSGWKRALIYALALVAVGVLVFGILRLVDYAFYLR